ncbi:unnamed protein product [Prunus armeniaca]
MLIKGATFYPAKTTHLGCCKPPSNHENSSKASIPSGTFQFHALFFHLPHFSLSQNPHLGRASIISHLWNPSISSLVLQLLPIFSSVKSPRSLTKLSSSCWKYAKATQASIFFLSFHKHTLREQSSSFIPETPAISSHIP